MKVDIVCESLLELGLNDVDATVHVVEGSNSAAVRQEAMKTFGRYVCFIESGCGFPEDGWLDALVAAIQTEDVGLVCSVPSDRGSGVVELEPDRGITRCFLIDTERVGHLQWVTEHAYREGWFGGGGEDLDFCYQMAASGIKILACRDSYVSNRPRQNHAVCETAMQHLVELKHKSGDPDYLDGLVYVREGTPLKKCYAAILRKHKLFNDRFFIDLNLV